MEDDSKVFLNVARIPDAMLQKFDPADPVLVAYLQTANPSIETGVLLPKGIEGNSKRGKNLKTVSKASLSKPDSVPTPKKVTKPVHILDPKEPAKEVVPSKSSVLKRLNKMAHSPRHSPDR